MHAFMQIQVQNRASFFGNQFLLKGAASHLSWILQELRIDQLEL